VRGRHLCATRLQNGDLHIVVSCAAGRRCGSEQCDGGCGVDERRQR
jgi:hypothetical protein